MGEVAADQALPSQYRKSPRPPPGSGYHPAFALTARVYVAEGPVPVRKASRYQTHSFLCVRSRTSVRWELLSSSLAGTGPPATGNKSCMSQAPCLLDRPDSSGARSTRRSRTSCLFAHARACAGSCCLPRSHDRRASSRERPHSASACAAWRPPPIPYAASSGPPSAFAARPVAPGELLHPWS